MLSKKAQRISSAWKSFRVLYNLPPEKVKAFVDAYEIYKYDWKDEAQIIEKMGPDYYKEFQKKLVDWYSVINHLCTLGEVEKMYIPPAMDLSLGIIDNQILFERRLASDLHIGPGDTVLDIGCGRGRIVMHVGECTGAAMHGINLDPDQINNAREFAKEQGIEDLCRFEVWDMNNIPFNYADESVDAVYHVQAFSISKDLGALMREIHRILKPGKRFACLDWISLPQYNPEDPEHQRLMSEVKPLVGAIGTPRAEDYSSALRNAGFKIVEERNLSIDGLQAPLIERADVYFNRVFKTVRFLTKYKMLPQHFDTLLDRLTQGGQAFVKADRMRIVTTSHYIVAEKQ